jgi:hypothetical protein
LRGNSGSDSLAESLAVDIVHEVESLLGRQAVQDLSLDALEMAVRRRVLCYAGRRQKRFRSALGDWELERAYYHGSRGGRGFRPRDGKWAWRAPRCVRPLPA